MRRNWRRGLTENVLRLGIVSFFADVSSEMLYPLMPIFLTATLGAPVSAVGLIEGSAQSVAALLQTVSGRLADRTGRRIPLVFGGYLLSAIAKPVMALAQAWPGALFARVVDRAGKGFRDAPRDAVLADSIRPQDRGAAFGWHRTMDTLGAVLGPLLALGLLSLVGGKLRHVIAYAAIPGAISAVLVLTVSDPRSRARQNAFGGSESSGSPDTRADRFAWSVLPKGFRQYLGAWLPFVLVNSSDVFLILRAKELGFTTVHVVLLYTLYNLVYSLAALPLGRLSDIVGRRRVLIGGMAVFALVYAGFSIATVPWHVVVLFTVYGLYIAATDGVGKAYAVDLVPARIRATSVGMLGTLTGVATLVASAGAGLLWDVVGPWAPFAFGAGGALLSALLLWVLPGLKTKAAGQQV